MNKILGISELAHYGLYLRGIVITLYAIILFRTSSARLFGEHAPLDFIIFIVLGAILGEAIVNNIPLLPSMLVCLLIVLIHRFLAYITYKSKWMGAYIKGNTVEIITEGKYINKNLRCCRITENDLLQALRIQHSLENISTVKTATLERGGTISFIFKS